MRQSARLNTIANRLPRPAASDTGSGLALTTARPSIPRTDSRVSGRAEVLATGTTASTDPGRRKIEACARSTAKASIGGSTPQARRGAVNSASRTWRAGSAASCGPRPSDVSWLRPSEVRTVRSTIAGSGSRSTVAQSTWRRSSSRALAPAPTGSAGSLASQPATSNRAASSRTGRGPALTSLRSTNAARSRLLLPPGPPMRTATTAAARAVRRAATCVAWRASRALRPAESAATANTDITTAAQVRRPGRQTGGRTRSAAPARCGAAGSTIVTAGRGSPTRSVSMASGGPAQEVVLGQRTGEHEAEDLGAGQPGGVAEAGGERVEALQPGVQDPALAEPAGQPVDVDDRLAGHQRAEVGRSRIVLRGLA